MNLSEKAMNASEKRILKLAIILFTIGLIVRYLPWGLPSIESFEVGEAIVVNSHVDSAHVDSIAVPNKIKETEKQAELVELNDPVTAERSVHHRKSKKKVVFPLNINMASAEDLCAIKGVGPKLAEKIIERRNAFGPYKNASDLKKVHGIGKKKLEMMLQSIIFD